MKVLLKKIDADNIRDDLQQNDSNDQEISHVLALLRFVHKKKELPYYELLRSRQTGTFRYLLAELNDKFGRIIITNLDTQESFLFENEQTNTKEINDEQNRSDASDGLRQDSPAESAISCAAEIKRVSGLLGRRNSRQQTAVDLVQKKAA